MQRIKFHSELLSDPDVSSKLLQFVNCSVLRKDGLRKEHIWVRNGEILNEKAVFFEEKKMADLQVSCRSHKLFNVNKSRSIAKASSCLLVLLTFN